MYKPIENKLSLSEYTRCTVTMHIIIMVKQFLSLLEGKHMFCTLRHCVKCKLGIMGSNYNVLMVELICCGMSGRRLSSSR